MLSSLCWISRCSALILWYGIRLKNILIQLFTLGQAVLLVIFELFMVEHVEVPAFAADNLSLIMVLIISIVGSLICVFGLPYMDAHEKHLHLEKSKQPQFFFYLVLFLGAMNGLVLANNILWLYFFFEVTTFCSFMLIGHDGNQDRRGQCHPRPVDEQPGRAGLCAGHDPGLQTACTPCPWPRSFPAAPRVRWCSRA